MSVECKHVVLPIEMPPVIKCADHERYAAVMLGYAANTTAETKPLDAGIIKNLKRFTENSFWPDVADFDHLTLAEKLVRQVTLLDATA